MKSRMRVALQIRLKLASSPGTRASINPEAYDLYLKGRNALDQDTADDLNLAFVYFRQGIEKDPQYAPLYAGWLTLTAAFLFSRTKQNSSCPPLRDSQDATGTQNSMFGIRNLRKPRELSQPNQLDMVGERGFEPLPVSCEFSR